MNTENETDGRYHNIAREQCNLHLIDLTVHRSINIIKVRLAEIAYRPMDLKVRLVGSSFWKTANFHIYKVEMKN